MSTQEHLQLIIAHCKKNLELAEKRTPGKWEKSQSTVTNLPLMTYGGHSLANTVYSGDNAAFIAACSQFAEAGWKVTIAAIKSKQEAHDFFRISGLPGQRQRIENDMQQIIESFPIESL